MATLNIGIKVNRVITGADTVSAGAYAMVDYKCGGHGLDDGDLLSTNNGFQGISALPQGSIHTRHFGPGATIPATFTTSYSYFDTAGTTQTGTLTWTLIGGVELINTL